MDLWDHSNNEARALPLFMTGVPGTVLATAMDAYSASPWQQEGLSDQKIDLMADGVDTKACSLHQQDYGDDALSPRSSRMDADSQQWAREGSLSVEKETMQPQWTTVMDLALQKLADNRPEQLPHEALGQIGKYRRGMRGRKSGKGKEENEAPRQKEPEDLKENIKDPGEEGTNHALATLLSTFPLRSNGGYLFEPAAEQLQEPELIFKFMSGTHDQGIVIRVGGNARTFHLIALLARRLARSAGVHVNIVILAPHSRGALPCLIRASQLAALCDGLSPRSNQEITTIQYLIREPEEWIPFVPIWERAMACDDCLRMWELMTAKEPATGDSSITSTWDGAKCHYLFSGGQVGTRPFWQLENLFCN
jgi:hypothetical protein